VKKLLIVIVVIVSVVGLIAGYIIYNSKPDQMSDKARQEALGQILGRKPNLNPNIKTGNTTFTGKYISLTYPGRAKVYEYVSDALKKDPAFLETFSFDIEAPRTVFNYSAYANKSEMTGIDEVPAVAFRQNKSNGYSQKEVTVDGEQGLTFSKQGSGENPSEVSTFFFKDNVIYALSFSGNNMEDTANLSKEILGTVAFMQ
jgi:hypothetical protein